MYSGVLGKLQPDYPPATEIVGFALYDRHEEASSAALENFLAAGKPPLVFTQGTSAVHDADVFIRESLAAVATLGARAVFVLDATRAREWQAHSSPDVFIAGYAPYSALFPRAAVIVHHGGIGTTGQALRAGRPQLIVPYLVDQPDNARRVARLGCGVGVSAKKYTRERVVIELRRLLDDPSINQRAEEVGRIVAQENGAERAADIIVERLVQRARKDIAVMKNG